MTTEYDPDVHRTALTDQNGNPLQLMAKLKCN